MGGILAQVSIEEAAVQAVLAGTDLIEICRDPALILRAYEAILAEAERSPAFRGRVELSFRRITQFKSEHFNAAMPRNPSSAQLNKLRADTIKFAGAVQ
jgi:beta-N-acetylhexosaminidase